MSSQKIRALTFRTLSVIFSILLLIIIIESGLRLILSPEDTFQKQVSEKTKTPSTNKATTPSLFEIPTTPNSIFYKKSKHHPSDKGSLLYGHHVDPHIHDLFAPTPHFDGQVKRVRSDGQTVIFDVHVSTDSRGRRITPTKSDALFKKHVVLMGCSYAFGEAVENKDTLLAHLHDLHPDIMPYNAAFSGYGPNDVLARILKYHFLSDIQPQDGLGLYLYTDNHIKRFVHAMSVLQWSARPIALEKQSPNTYNVLGRLQDTQPLRYFLLKWLSRSRLMSYFNIDWPMEITASDYDRLAEVFKAIEYQYKMKTQSTNPFIVVLYPERSTTTNIHYLKQSLDKMRILHIDYTATEMENRIPVPSRIDYDGHPTSSAYKHLAEMISTDLNKYLK